MSTTIALRIYVVTARPLSAARDENIKKITEYFSKACVVERVTRCTKNDPEDLLKTNVSDHVDFSSIPGESAAIANLNNNLKHMHVNQLSNAMKHVDALRKIAGFADTEASDELIHLVIEDDCVVNEDLEDCDNAKDAIKDLMNRVKITFSNKNNRWGIFLPCLSVAMTEQAENTQTQFFVDNKVVKLNELILNGSSFLVPACNAYFVTPSFAKRMLRYCEKIKFAWNVHLSYAVHFVLHEEEESEQVIGTRTIVIMDGSKTGHFVSTLTGTNLLSLCPEYIELVRLISSTSGTTPKETCSKAAEIISKFEQKNGVIKDHPDFLRLYAQQLIGIKKLRDAHSVLKKGSKVLLETPLAIINNTSSFMREYLNSFAYVQ